MDLLALPAMATLARPASTVSPVPPNPMAVPISLAGHPALWWSRSRPADRFPASLQLVGPDRSEDRLVVAGAMIEGAVAAG